MPNQPVQTTEPPLVEPDPGWDSRLPLGRILRLAALALPVVLCIGFALVLIAVLPAPTVSGQSAGWWITLALAVVVMAVGSNGLLARIAPLVPLPLLSMRWPHFSVVAIGASAGIVAALTIPGGTPELIAYANFETAEDTELSVAIGGGNPPDSLTILKIDGPATARWNGTDIVITGEPNANGDVLVTYEACWDDDCAEGELFATFTPVNDDPIAEADIVEATEVGPVTLAPLVNDVDLDQDTLQVESAEIVTGRASVEVAGNDLVVTPDDDEPQTIDLSYTVSDGVGGTGEGTAQVVIPDFNEAPVVIGETVTVVAGEAVEVNVLDNDVDPDGDLMFLQSAKMVDPTQGVIEVSDGTVRFTAALITATAEVRYEVSDGERLAPGLLTVTIEPPPPRPVDDLASTAEDTAVSFDVIGNDLAPASSIDAESVRVISATLGSATAASDGAIRFVPKRDAYGIGSVTYEVCNLGGKCSEASAEVQITRVNDAPTFRPGSDVLARSGEIFSRQWASGISVGEANEPTQSVTFIVTAADPSLFATPPSIDKDGVLWFNAGLNIGTTQVTVIASDGQDQSAPATFRVSIS